MTHTEDLVWVDKIRNGNPASYTYIVDKYQHMVYTISMKILSNPDDAKDSAQESFIKAYQQIGSFAGKSRFSTWLYTIAYRTAISKFKANRVVTVEMNEEINECYISDHTASGLEQLQLKQQKKQVEDGINQLPKIEALLITMYYINEMPVKEIEEITGLGTSNIKIQLFRARKKLERNLRPLLNEELKNTI
ncbi:RNA polymerase sigma-70 factor, ECF subfamily [Pedobacter westerhofensis]|uniref:RNA polymerase sigma-70 factor, ECF subfamily n=1 Tax=Pedobacter westerhofensis TaxID=425512 RepID=A0A521FF03_9SPHI|nr:sigma-70 family RNA polymerase sigma factor [Pedobacter westerhofensis]SMO94251.1 RNA polymerase sigma-70 factor, ECF subfamily [Pedobacter westerhofensis]